MQGCKSKERAAAVPQHPQLPGLAHSSSTLHAPPGLKAHKSGVSAGFTQEGSKVGRPESSGQLALACQRTGDSPITLSPLLILITPLRPLLSNKTLIQVLRGIGSLLLVVRREEKTYSESSAVSPCEYPLHLYRHSPQDRPQSQPTGATAASMGPSLHPSWGWSSSQHWAVE